MSILLSFQTKSPYQTVLLLASILLGLTACSGTTIESNQSTSTPTSTQQISQTFTPPSQVSVPVSGQNYNLAPHPRIFIGGAMSLTDLRNKADNTNKYWVWFRDSMINNSQSDPQFPLYTDGSYNPHFMASYALMYLVDPTTYLDMGTAAVNMMKNHSNMDTYCDGSRTCGNPMADYGRHNLRKIAYTWDWTYDLLTQDDKEHILTWVNNHLIPLINKHPQNIEPHHNLMHTHLTSLLAFSLATYEDNPPGLYDNGGISIPLGEPVPSEQAKNPYLPKAIGNNSHEYFRWAMQGWSGDLAFGQPTSYYVNKYYKGGHSNSGSSYSYNRSTRYMFYNVMLLKSAIGMDLWDASKDWTENFIDYTIHTTLPTGDEIYSDGNVGGNAWDSRSLEPLNIALHYYGAMGSPAADRGYHFIENIIKPDNSYTQGKTTIHNYYKYKWFLWLDPSNTGTDYSNTLNTGYVSEGTDLFQSRGDWNNTNSTWASLSASDWVGDHQGKNYGSYKIFKSEHLIYENDNDGNGSENDTNIITLDDEIAQRWYGQPVTTGGLRYTGDHGIAPLSADITDSYSLAKVNYAKADLWDVYVKTPTMKKVEDNNFTRETLHIKPANPTAKDYVIIYDKIKTVSQAGTTNNLANGLEVVKSHTYHVSAQPSIDNGTKTISFNGPEGKSKLLSKVIFPAQVNIQKTDADNKTSFGHDVWKVKVSNTNNPQFDRFLIVHMPTTDLSATLPTIDSFNGTNCEGVTIHDPDKISVIVFNSNEPKLGATATISYSTNYTGTGSHSIHGLQPGVYNLYINSILDRQIDSNDKSYLHFETSTTGNYNLVKQ